MAFACDTVDGAMTASDGERIQALKTSGLGKEPRTWAALAACLTETRLDQGDTLFRQNDEADSLHIVLEGRLAVSLDGAGAGLVVEDVVGGGVVGEMALILGGKRTATVRAVAESRLLTLSREKFEVVSREHPDVVRDLSRALHERVRRTMLAGHLRTLFSELSKDELRELEGRVEWVQLRTGQELFHEGDAADAAYIVAMGRLRVTATGPAGEERTLNEVGPGEWLGEMALIAKRPRSGTVYAVRDTELVRLSRPLFEELVRRYPDVLLSTSRLLIERLERHMHASRVQTSIPRSIAIVPIDPAVEVGWIAEGLAAALAVYGRAVHLSSDRVDGALGRKGLARVAPSDPAHVRVSSWLAAQENDTDFVVYQADREWTEWSERTTRHADLVVFVADAAGSPALSRAERAFAALGDPARLPRQALVLVQRGSGSSFPGTAKWLTPRRVAAHYHVRNAADVRRLSRLLTRRGVGLVLGGGGSRGYAHIGVVRAFEELGIPIDAAGGASIGAMVAGACALELTSRDMLKLMPPLLRGAFRDPTLPWVSLMKGNTVLRGAKVVAGDSNLEDLARPAFIVTTNLTRGRAAIHRTGSVALAIRASSAIPGIFPPVSFGGDLHVDGGVSNNVPIDAMDEAFGGSIVAIDVIPEVDLEARSDFPPTLSGWAAAWDRIRHPLNSRIPSIFSVLMRSATATSTGLRGGQDAATKCDLCLRPSLSRWNVVDFGAAKAIADEGYAGTVKAIESWWSSKRDAVLGKVS